MEMPDGYRDRDRAIRIPDTHTHADANAANNRQWVVTIYGSGQEKKSHFGLQLSLEPFDSRETKAKAKLRPKLKLKSKPPRKP